MKKLIIAVLSVMAAGSALAANVGVAVSIGDPNFYGQIDIGSYPQPALIYSQPVVINAPGFAYQPAPLYLRVPVEHYRDWRHYCGRYNACGRPVYFVQDNWYRNVYVPRYREQYRVYSRPVEVLPAYGYEGRREDWHGEHRGEWHEGWRDGRYEERRDDRHDDRRHDDRREAEWREGDRR